MSSDLINYSIYRHRRDVKNFTGFTGHWWRQYCKTFLKTFGLSKTFNTFGARPFLSRRVDTVQNGSSADIGNVPIDLSSRVTELNDVTIRDNQLINNKRLYTNISIVLLPIIILKYEL